MNLNKGVVTSASPLRVRPSGSTSSLRASFLVGSSPAVNAKVLWAYVGRQIVVFTYTDVS